MALMYQPSVAREVILKLVRGPTRHMKETSVAHGVILGICANLHRSPHPFRYETGLKRPFPVSFSKSGTTLS